MPEIPQFTKGRPLRSEITAERLNAVADATITEVVGGTLIPASKGGKRLVVAKQRRPDTRASVVYGTDSVTLGTGNSLPLNTLESDVDETNEAEALLVDTDGLASSFVPIRKPGLFLLTYHASLELDIGGATSATAPGTVGATVYLRAGGTTVPGSTSYAQAAKLANLTGFVKTDGAALEQSADMDGITATSPTYGTIEVPQGTGADNVATWSADATVLYSEDGFVTTTTDTGQTAPVDSNAAAISTYTPTGKARAAVSGTALVRVVYDPADPGQLKIDMGGTLYDTALDLYGVQTGGDVTSLSCSLSLTLLTA